LTPPKPGETHRFRSKASLKALFPSRFQSLIAQSGFSVRLGAVSPSRPAVFKGAAGGFRQAWPQATAKRREAGLTETAGSATLAQAGRHNPSRSHHPTFWRLAAKRTVNKTSFQSTSTSYSWITYDDRSKTS